VKHSKVFKGMLPLINVMEIQTSLHTHSYKILPEIFSEDEIKKIMETINNDWNYRKDIVGEWLKYRNKTLIMTCYELALRPKEVCMIKLGDLDMKNWTITISPSSNKVKQGRKVAVPERLKSYLIEYLSFPKSQFWRFSDYLFPSLSNPYLSRCRFTEIFRKVLKKSGIYKYPTRGKHGNYSVYTLRHTKATEVYSKTKDAMVVSNILGHKTLESTKVYIHLSSMKKGYMEYMRQALS